MRTAFYRATDEVLRSDPRTAIVLAEISVAALEPVARRHPERFVNVGIREQLMVSVAGGLALTGIRPIVHTYAPFLVERAWEQLKLDLNHQDAGAILVSVGASHDSSRSGRTHHSPGDVALLDTLDGWTVHVPGHADEVGPALIQAATGDDRVYIRLAEQSNHAPHQTDGSLLPLVTGSRAVVVAVGPMLDRVLTATEGLDVTVAYANRPRPFDGAGLRELVWATATPATVVLVEPYLAGTSAHVVASALEDVPHRLVSLGVGRPELHRYGGISDHDRAHGLDSASIRKAVETAARS